MASESGYLLDTNVVVHLARDSDLGKYIDDQFQLSDALHRAAISVITVGEMHSLASQWSWSKDKITSLDKVLEQIVWIGIDYFDLIRAYGDIDADNRKRGAQRARGVCPEQSRQGLRAARPPNLAPRRNWSRNSRS